MEWTSDNVLAALYIAVAVMLIIVLYHTLFIVVDLRKMLRSWRTISDQVENVIMKPLSITDKAMEWVMGYLEQGKKHHKE